MTDEFTTLDKGTQSPEKCGDCPLLPSFTLLPVLPGCLSQLIVGIGPHPKGKWRVNWAAGWCGWEEEKQAL
jgi:hypothetical protein